MNVSPSLKLSDADIPPLPPKLNRRDYSTDAAFSAAQAQRAEVTQQRRKLKEKLRDQKRDRSGRGRPADDGAQATKRRQDNPDAVRNHRTRESTRYEASQPEVTQADIALTRIVDAGEKRPDWEWLKGAQVTKRARRKGEQQKATAEAKRVEEVLAQREEAKEGEQCWHAAWRARQEKQREKLRAGYEAQRVEYVESTTRWQCKEIGMLAQCADYDQHAQLISAWLADELGVIQGHAGRADARETSLAELDAARARAGLYCDQHPAQVVRKCRHCCFFTPGLGKSKEGCRLGGPIKDRALKGQCPQCCEELVAEALEWSRLYRGCVLDHNKSLREWLDERAPVDRAAIIRCEDRRYWARTPDCIAFYRNDAVWTPGTLDQYSSLI